jgi:hypothetical protein
MLGQGRGHPADEPAGRLVARAGDDRDVHQDLVAGQRAPLAVRVLELRVQQLGHDVVGGVLDPPVDVIAERLVRDDDLFAEVDLAALGGGYLRAGLLAEGDLALLGNADQHADHPHRHLQAERLDDVEPLLADQWVKAADAELADLRLERGDPARGEHARHELAVNVVDGRIREDERAGRHLHVHLDQLEDGAPGRGERAGVRQAPLHVGEAAHRVEVVGLVVVQRGFGAYPVEERPRVGREARVVRVPVERVGVHGACLPVLR